ncbi:MAG: exostosin family protein [Geminicoccaceae bacterium]
MARERWRWRADAARLGPAGVAALLAKTELVPMGYCKQLDLPLLPFAERRRVFSFRGSVDNYRAGLLSKHALTNYPKRIARQRFLAALREVARQLPGDACDLRITTDFDDSLQDAGRDYSAALMDSRFCLCPRGTRLETFRIFEGLRYGCITVTEALPDRWYLRGAPLVTVGDWRELPDLLRRLLADPGAWRSCTIARSPGGAT